MSTPDTAPATGHVPSFDEGISAFINKTKTNKADDFVTPPVTDVDENGYPIEEAEQADPITDGQEATETETVDEPQETETQEPDTRPIILADGSEITVEEARKGYLRQSDFTRKTMELAKAREELAAREQVAARELGGLYQQLTSLQEPEPDWYALARDPNTDPKQLQTLQAYWQHKTNVLGQTRQRISQIEAQTRNAAITKTREVLSSGEFEPKWKDPKALQTGLDTVNDYLLERGVPNELLNEATHHVLIEIAEESRRYRELQKAKPKAALAVRGKPAPFKPGPKSTETPQSAQLQSLKEKYRNNPSMENGIALERFKASIGPKAGRLR